MPYISLRSLALDSLPLMLKNLLGFSLHDSQIEAIRSLIVDQIDLILIALTGWGKSIIFQSIPAIQDGVYLMIMPLNLFKEEQVS